MKINKTKSILLLMAILIVTLLNADGFQFTLDRNLTISGGYVNSWADGSFIGDFNSNEQFTCSFGREIIITIYGLQT